MGRTQLTRSIIAELEKRIVICKQNKQKLISYVQILKNKCINREINYYEYEQILNQKRDGKTIQEWLDFYDSYIEDCEERIKQQQNKIIKNKVFVSFISFSIILFIIFAFFYMRPVIIGLVVQEEQAFTQTINLEFSETSEYTWNLENLGQLNSVKISGLIEGQGEVKVYLDDLLILDSNNIKQKSSGVTGATILEEQESSIIKIILGFFKKAFSTITGRTGGEIVSDSSSLNSQKPTSPESSSEKKQEAPQKSSPSQQEPLVSETQAEQPSTPEASEETQTTEQPEEQPITPTETKEQIEQNITKPTEEEQPATPEQPTEEEQPEKEIKPTIIEFSDYCEETCKNLKLTKSSYTLKIQITNSKLNLDTIAYEITPAEILKENVTLPEVPENITEENITEIPEVNVTEINVTEIPEVNVTEINVTEIPENITANITAENITISTIQLPAKLGEKVKWKKHLTPEETGQAIIKLPKQAENITIRKQSEDITSSSTITGAAIEEIEKKGTLSKFFRNLLSILTGQVIQETSTEIVEQPTPETQESEIEVEVEIDELVEYEVEYETPAPQAFEENITKGKKIIITSPENLIYENVLAYTQLEKEAKQENIKLYKTTNNEKREIQFTSYDNNNNGLIDYIEWTAEDSNNQTYELIIEITKAEHLDENRIFISDIYEQVYQLDDVWSEPIPDMHYVRVIFRQPLDNTRDITIYPRIVSGTPTIKVYEKDKSELIAEFSSLKDNEYNKVYLTNLQGEQDTFDLLILDGEIEIDHIIDPTPVQYFLIGKTTAGSGGTGDMFASTGSATAIWTPTASGDYFTWIKKYTETTTLDIQTFSLGFYCNQSGSAGGDSIKIGTIDIYDCGTSADCSAQDFTICSSNTINIDCESGATVEHKVASCTSSGSRTLNANDYLGVRLTSNTNKAAYPSVEFNSSTYNTYFNVTETIQDNTAPTLSIDYPQNTTYNLLNVDVNEINFTAHDETELSACWYSTDDGINNYSNADWTCYENFTSVTSLEGSNNFTVWANDTGSNKQTASVVFVKDTLTPSFSNYEDDNSSHESTGTGNFSVDVLNTNGTVLLQINNTNYTAENYVDNKYNASVDFDINDTWSYYWISYSNFSENINTSEDILNFYTINGTPPDGTPPTLSIDYPANTTYNLLNVDVNELNFTASDNVALDVCWYSTNGGDTNSSFNDCYSNFTSVTSVEGSNNFTVWANDTNSNEQTTSVVFVKDILIPTFLNYLDDNASLEGSGTGNFSVDVLDTNGTVLLQINNTNYTAENYADNKYNASVDFDINDTWQYYWISYSNFSQNQNTSEDVLNFYTINNTLNTAPTIIDISSIPNTAPTEADSVTINFNLTVDDQEGVSNIDNNSIIANFTRPFEPTRENSCSPISGENNETSQNFTCNIDMWYFDENGIWNITISANDTSNLIALNETEFFQYNLLQAIQIAPETFNFNAVIGGENQTATDSTLINNTGNANITEGNVQVQGINVYGASGAYIGAGNFSVDIETGGDSCSGAACIECDGAVLANGSYTGITNAYLPRGNLSLGEAQEQIYYCLIKVPDNVISETYSTSNDGSDAWIIKIVVALAVFYIPKKKKKTLKDDKLIQAFELIADKLKEEYPLNKKQIMKIILEKLRAKYNISKKEIEEMLKLKEELNIPIIIFSKELGALEAITKYLKENLNLSYREISKLLNRDERTIWSSYNKAQKKHPEKLEIKKSEIFLPLSIFKSKLTILESIIIYLKSKEMRYSEIAKLLSRDQRNIWTIYSRAVRKLKKNS